MWKWEKKISPSFPPTCAPALNSFGGEGQKKKNSKKEPFFTQFLPHKRYFWYGGKQDQKDHQQQQQQLQQQQQQREGGRGVDRLGAATSYNEAWYNSSPLLPGKLR